MKELDAEHPHLAEALCTALLTGRDEPSRTVAEQRSAATSATPSWPWQAWAALGIFAAEYGLAEEGTTCFLAVEETGRGEVAAGRWTALAGFALVRHHPDRARELLEGVRHEPAARALSAIGLAVLDHGSQPGPVPTPEEVRADPDRSAREPSIQRFLGDQCLIRGDLDAAVDHYERVLGASAGHPATQIALAQALLTRAARGSSLVSTIDLRKAANLADAARAARRRWHANSTEAALVLFLTRLAAAEYDAAFRVALPAPYGEASPQEAASAELAARTASAVLAQRRWDLADQLVNVVEQSGTAALRSQIAAARAEALGEDRSEVQRLWRVALADAENDEQRTISMYHLAGTGYWPIAELDEVLARGGVPGCVASPAPEGVCQLSGSVL